MRKQSFFKKTFKKSTAFALSCTMLTGMVQVPALNTVITANAATANQIAADDCNDDWLHTEGSDIVDKNGNVVRLTGANWFGFNCGERVLHGLWSADIRQAIKSCADRGINILRIPISTELLLEWKNGEAEKAGNFSNSPDWTFNPDLVNEDGTAMNTLQVMDKLMVLCKEYGVKVLIDCHSAKADNSGHVHPMWYNTEAGITTQDWIDGWKFIVERYKNDDTFIAADLENEPHGKADEEEYAKWDDSQDVNNWKYAAEECAKAILEINPNMLILVEGIEQNPKEGYTYDSPVEKTNEGYINFEGAWWGGNLRLVGDKPMELGNDDWNDQIMYSPHDYGPSVYNQTWFDKDFTEQTLLDDYWYDAWAYLVDENISPLLMGEWGGHMDGGKNEKWLNLLAEYMNKKNISHTFWCLNPNSGDTGGLWDSSFTTWDEKKYAILEKTLWQTASGQYIGLDHQTPLGENGITIDEFYGNDSGDNKIAVTGIEVSTTEVTVETGKSETVTAKVTPSNATNKTILWDSSDTDIAEVSKSGVITGHKAGEVTVTAKTEDGNYTAEIKVTVTKAEEVTTEVEATTEKPAEPEVTTEKPAEPEVTTEKPAEPEVTTEKPAEPEVTTEKPAEPEVTTEKPAEPEVTTEKPAEPEVTTEKPAEPEVTTETPAEPEVTTEKPAEPEVTTEKPVKPEVTTEKPAEPEVTTEKPAKPDVTTQKPAESDGTTQEPADTTVAVDSVTLNVDTLELSVGNTAQLIETISPAEATNKAVIYETSNEKIVRVTENGYVMAVGAGTAAITVTTLDGKKKATCTVTVIEKTQDQTVHVTGLSFADADKWEAVVGDEKAFSVVISPADATDKTVEWKSTDETVATVDQNGKVTAVGAGTAFIIVTSKDSGKWAMLTVHVSEKASGIVSVTGVTLNYMKLALKPGQQESLVATIEPETATNQGLTWLVDDTNVAVVDENGVVTALSEGTAIITAKTNDGNLTAKCVVTVKEEKVAVTGITMPSQKIEVTVDDVKQLYAYVSPDGADNQKIIWKTTNDSVVSVEQNGQITAKSKGTATITAISDDGGYEATCEVTVLPKADTTVKVENVKLDEESWAMKPGDTKKLEATIAPSDATNKKVHWKSSDYNVVTVDEEGNITALTEGFATISVATEDGGKIAMCNVEVTSDEQKVIPVKDITIDKINDTLKPNDTVVLIATISPSNATNKEITWSSEDKTIADVDENGVVTAKKEGVVAITAMTNDGSKYATCTIIVKEEKEDTTISVTGVILNETAISLEEGKDYQLTATVSPKEASNQLVHFTTSNSSVVEVDPVTGKVTAVGTGTADITATTDDGSKKAVCKVTVTAKSQDVTTEDKDAATEDKNTTTEDKNTTTGDKNTTTEDKNTTTGDKNTTTGDKDTTVDDKKDNDTTQGDKSNTTTQNTPASADTTGNNKADSTTAANQTAATVPVTSVSVLNTMLQLTVGKTSTVVPIIEPVGATNKTVTYTSSDSTVVTVDANGNIKALKPGMVQITVTAADNKTASCQVVVKPSKVTGLKKSKVKKTSLALSWKKVSSVSGYKVYRYDSKSKKYKLYKTVTSNKLTVKKLKKGKGYKFKVVAYKKVSNTTILGSYSKVLQVKTKK